MRIIIFGPGRAGVTLAIASRNAGHELVGVVGKNRYQADSAAEAFATTGLVTGDTLPAADLVMICTRDDAIAGVATEIAPQAGSIRAAVHVSGVTPVAALASLDEVGVAIGSFHPLQTLPSGEAGAQRLAGSWIAITASGTLRATLGQLAESLGCHPFDLADDAKPLYHAAAAAAANFPLVALAMAADLFAGAGVPFEAARPMVEAVVANAFELGPLPSLTGPVARGDHATVEAQLHAVADGEPRLLADFAAAVMAIARLSGRAEEFEGLMEQWTPRPSADEQSQP